jgi:hypothetical protein
MRALIANIPKLQESAEPASAEGSLLGHPETSTRHAPRIRPLPSEVHAIDLGPGAAAARAIPDQLTLDSAMAASMVTRKQRL